MKLTIIIPVIGLIIILALVGLLVTQSPSAGEGVVEGAIENVLSLDSLSSDLVVEVTDGLSGSRFLIGLTSSLDKSDPEVWQSNNQLSLDISAGGQELVATVDLRVIGKILYAKINSLSGDVLSFIDDAILSFFKAQWIEIDTEEVKELAGDAYNTSQIMDFEQAKIFLDQLSALFKEKSILKIEKELGAEQIDGDNTNHYLVSVDKASLKELVPEYLDLAQQYVPQDQLTAYTESKEEVVSQALAGIDVIWDRLGPIEFDVWITTKGSYLKKIKFEKSIEDISVNLQITLSDFNEPVSVETPTNTILVNDLITLFMTEAAGLLPEDIDGTTTE